MILYSNMQETTKVNSLFSSASFIYAVICFIGVTITTLPISWEQKWHMIIILICGTFIFLRNDIHKVSEETLLAIRNSPYMMVILMTGVCVASIFGVMPPLTLGVFAVASGLYYGKALYKMYALITVCLVGMMVNTWFYDSTTSFNQLNWYVISMFTSSLILYISNHDTLS
jgi:hypothetical protein